MLWASLSLVASLMLAIRGAGRHPLRLLRPASARRSVGWEIGTATRTGISLRLLPSGPDRSEAHTSELQSLMHISYAVFCLTNNTQQSYMSTNASSTPLTLTPTQTP